jgi:hypothetical protein
MSRFYLRDTPLSPPLALGALATGGIAVDTPRVKPATTEVAIALVTSAAVRFLGTTSGVHGCHSTARVSLLDTRLSAR